MTNENRKKFLIMLSALFIAGSVALVSVSKKCQRERRNAKIEATIDVLQKRNIEMAAQIKKLNQADVTAADKRAAVNSLNKQISMNNARINSLKHYSY